MREIQKQLYNPVHSETLRVFVKAKPETAWEVARYFDGSTIPWKRLLFDTRLITDLNNGKKDSAQGLESVSENLNGFMLLSEIPGKEVLVGAIGQFWNMDTKFANVKPENFAAFAEPGWGKIAWSITVEPYNNGSTICFELRTAATDKESWNKLNNYYYITLSSSKLIRESFMAHLETVLGKMKFPTYDIRSLPGDELIPESEYELSYSVNIEAPLSTVWKYLMQLGCDRGGWFSIDLIDHGGGSCPEQVVSEWKNRCIGDKLPSTPQNDSFYEVYDIEPEKYIILGEKSERLDGTFKMSWAFILGKIGEDSTCLMSRARMESPPKWAKWFSGELLYPPVHGLMLELQLKTIKRYAEGDSRSRVSELVKEMDPVS